ncbi:VanZ family protein [Priestia taiwanensis]|uniref:Antibiotic resistance protein VanZ n=1 Tax=Priestia taiwanensis TaxID=1347902 RepID=A0A917AVM9_9BACI|nr:VanZ family protein [Priestia taiwanensis]MBM7364803.1 glycopeptide antibiotics resistance protein [Priestia taiwanensis]GGE79809.1 antibiotic resistance protein VanZ [Priestia taiwanensis]
MIIIDFHNFTIVLLFFIFSIILCIYEYVKKKKNSFFTIVYKYSCILYGIFLIKYVFLPLTMFPDEFEKEIVSTFPYYQLIPLATITETIQETGNFVQIIGNAVLLFPLGVYLGLLDKKAISFKYVFLKITIITVSIETIQLMINFLTQYPNKIFDIDDIILNIPGGLLGWIIIKYLAPHLEKENIPTIFNKKNNYYNG